MKPSLSAGFYLFLSSAARAQRSTMGGWWECCFIMIAVSRSVWDFKLVFRKRAQIGPTSKGI